MNWDTVKLGRGYWDTVLMENYYTVMKQGLEKHLSIQELGVVYFMSCQADGFKFHIRWMSDQVGVSKNTMLKILTSLKDKGFVELKDRREKGKFTERYYVLKKDKVIHKSDNKRINVSSNARRNDLSWLEEDGSPF